MAASRALRERAPFFTPCLEVVEKGEDMRGVEVAQAQGGGLGARGLAQEHEQQSERVAIGGDGLRAGFLVCKQVLGEERLQERSEQGGDGYHDSPASPANRSKRCAAMARNRGVAVRYQYVSAGRTWPR
jgi:hypothetical protein